MCQPIFETNPFTLNNNSQKIICHVRVEFIDCVEYCHPSFKFFLYKLNTLLYFLYMLDWMDFIFAEADIRLQNK